MGRGRVARVLVDEPAIDKRFDYLVPDAFGDQVRVGDRVRVALAGRRVGGWIVALGVEPPAGVALRPLARWSGRGPTPDLLAEGWVLTCQSRCVSEDVRIEYPD